MITSVFSKESKVLHFVDSMIHIAYVVSIIWFIKIESDLFIFTFLWRLNLYYVALGYMYIAIYNHVLLDCVDFCQIAHEIAGSLVQ